MLINRQKIIVYVTNQALMASFWHGKQYQSHQTFQNQEVGHAAFRQYLSQHQNATIYVVVDTVEEEYQLEVLPHVTGSAKREMLARKLAQFNRNSVYKTAWFMRQETTSRKEDFFVLLSLTNPNFLKHWMVILQSEQALLAGVYALPMLTQSTVCQMKIVPSQLLVCERLSSGLRQSYLQSGRLRISRLTPIENKLSSPLMDFYVAEVEKMHLYLRSQKIINDEAVLKVMISSTEAEHNEIAARLSHQGLECQTANRMSNINKCHLKQADVTLHPELIYLQLLSKTDLSANLAPTEMTKAYRITQLTSRNYRMATIVAVVSLLITAYFFLQGFEASKQTNYLINQTDLLLKQHAFVVSRYPASPISGAALTAVVTAAQTVNQQSPLPLMQIISTVLIDVPEVSISRIRWVQSDQENIVDEDGQVLMEQANEASGYDKEMLQIGFVNAKINQLTEDYQETLATANRFVANLRADNRVSAVEVMQMPVNATFVTQGNTSDQLVSKPTSVVFKLKIILNQTENEDL